MKLVGRLWLLMLLVLQVSCTSQAPSGAAKTELDLPKLLNQGIAQLQVNPQRAISDYFDPVITACAYQYQAKDKKYYAARSPAEAIFYAAQATAMKLSVEVVDLTCADALFLKGFASVDLGQLDQAQDYYQKALAMAPENAQYLSELGHVYQVQQNWSDALAAFTQAESAAELSPEAIRQSELARAKRGIGYNLIELGQLDKAETKFNECLALDKNDRGALHELKYIQQLRAQ